MVGSDLSKTITGILGSYVGRDGKPIKSCTIVMRARHSQAWNIPEKMWNDVNRAAETLALACLAEQRFFEGHFSPHLNGTMFRLIGQGITANSDQISLFYPRRGGGLRIAGLRFKDVVFQRPPEVEGTECKVIGSRLIRALQSARRARHPVWEPITSSLELFLLGHAETSELGWDTCVMLSAMAFERLLECSGAMGVSEAFAKLWAPYKRLTVQDSKRIKRDHNGKFAEAQLEWPVHRKWMKELYEARSSKAHHGARADSSRNWDDWQHLVIASFTYPFAVKLRLSVAGLYELSDRELGACDALDMLLDSDWGTGWRRPPEWPTILSMEENDRALKAAVRRAFDMSEGRTVRAAARRGGETWRGYD